MVFPIVHHILLSTALIPLISEQKPDIVISRERRQRLLESTEIDLVTKSPHEPPFLGLQTPTLASLQQFEELMRTRVELLRRGCADTPQLGSESPINYSHLYVLKVGRVPSSFCQMGGILSENRGCLLMTFPLARPGPWSGARCTRRPLLTGVTTCSTWRARLSTR